MVDKVDILQVTKILAKFDKEGIQDYNLVRDIGKDFDLNI